MEPTLTHPKSRLNFPLHGYLGLASLLLFEILLALRVEPVLTWFTPIQWTGYILLLDAVLIWLGGQGYIFDQPKKFAYMLIVSVAVWFLFEGYNLHLQNWYYIHLPENLAVRMIGYVWAFATIFPGILFTSEVIDRLGFFHAVRIRPLKVSPGLLWGFIIFGVLCTTVPLLLAQDVAKYLFVFVWIGFIFLLDPINYLLKRPSLLHQLEKGSLQKLLSLFLAGWICGLLWEFWNYWAGTKWIYAVPYLSKPKLFEMPLFGYLGFLPFAVECYVFWQLFLYFWNPAKD
ncbi:MAG: hypothetical protein D6814_14195 [Calditrichaeota bacterium]|nr:MAG: hypothetical protein D6814_14195 [Calditrichota bacterium]